MYRYLKDIMNNTDPYSKGMKKKKLMTSKI